MIRLDNILEISGDHTLWSSMRDHMHQVGMAQVGLHDGGPRMDVRYLGYTVNGQVVGHISFTEKTLCVPASDLTHGKVVDLLDENAAPLRETFIETFGVDKAHQRKGYGRRLQEAALALSWALGCYQMRSWSSVDKIENYALKLSMGFAAHPALYPTSGGGSVSGIYFVMQRPADS